MGTKKSVMGSIYWIHDYPVFSSLTCQTKIDLGVMEHENKPKYELELLKFDLDVIKTRSCGR